MSIAIDDTATHFTATERKDLGGHFIVLYRFREVWPSYGQTECQCTKEMKERRSRCWYCLNKECGVRPQYKGPMGWKFHSADKDPSPDNLFPIERLEEVTGDSVDGRKINKRNMYAAT